MARLNFDSDMLDFGNCPLRFNSGDLLVDLTGNAKDVLVLHSEVLITASTFLAGAKATWSESNRCRVVKHPISGEDIKVLTYHLVWKAKDAVFMLDTNDASDPYSDEEGKPFYLSDYASHYLARSSHRQEEAAVGHGELRKKCVEEHQALFHLLYKTKFDIAKLSYDSIANVMAYEEMYDLLSLVAPAISAHLLQRPDIWSDIRLNAHFHLSLAVKLRSFKLYSDSMRHLVGSNAVKREYQSGLAFLTEDLDFDLQLTSRFVEKAGRLYHAVKDMGQRVLDLSDSYSPSHGIGVSNVASNSYSQWLQSGRTIGSEQLNWLRKVSNSAETILRLDLPLLLYNDDQWREGGETFLNEDGVQVARAAVNDRFRLLLRQMIEMVRSFATPVELDWDRMVPHIAGDEDGCSYFTCVHIDEEEDVPWEGQWVGYQLDGLEDISREWLVALGLEETT